MIQLEQPESQQKEWQGQRGTAHGPERVSTALCAASLPGVAQGHCQGSVDFLTVDQMGQLLAKLIPQTCSSPALKIFYKTKVASISF